MRRARVVKGIDSKPIVISRVGSSPIVDAVVNRVLPREVAQAVKGSNDTRFYRVGSGDVGKELPRNKSVLCLSFVGGLSHEAPTGNVFRMHVRSGDIP